MDDQEHREAPRSERHTDVPRVQWPEARGEFYDPYAWYARTVRYWFMAYGIGAPAAVLGNDRLYGKLIAGHCLQTVIGFFLAGILLQLCIAVLNRTAMWYLYQAENREPDFQNRLRVRVSDWFSDRYWPDLLFDLLTVSCFGIGTWIGLACICS